MSDEEEKNMPPDESEEKNMPADESEEKNMPPKSEEITESTQPQMIERTQLVSIKTEIDELLKDEDKTNFDFTDLPELQTLINTMKGGHRTGKRHRHKKKGKRKCSTKKNKLKKMYFK
jgi:hypothetical protein